MEDDNQDGGDQRRTKDHAKTEQLDKRPDTLSKDLGSGSSLQDSKQSPSLNNRHARRDREDAFRKSKSEEVFEYCKEMGQRKDSENVRTAGSGCSSPTSSTAGVDINHRLPPESPGAWSPSASQIHYMADSPLTPTRFRSKSEADTSTNPIHAQAIISTSVRPKERRTSSSSSTDAQSPVSVDSPRGEPAGSASGSLSLHGSSTAGSTASLTPSSSSRSRTPSLSPSGISSSAIPPVDPAALADIEKHCKRVADNVDLMMGHLSSTLQNMSAITVGHTQTYRDAVEKAGVTVDQSVKCMYALIAKCEELNRTMEPVHKLANQIKSVKRLLEEMEAACK
ncbi:uncharacterized protein LOC117307315 isoform X2 [Asterias rubens]|uniref:uncharacterized protein LOC117307315 isoform X2 n=1 Tax=Asterias rubens TaxID=7604 RepID=UPI0014553FBD|nr:uncharacterized protein LOC117307315 isoform X2 [Asterias rubens]